MCIRDSVYSGSLKKKFLLSCMNFGICCAIDIICSFILGVTVENRNNEVIGLSLIHLFDVYRDVSAEFQRIPADASEKMPDEQMDMLEPYNYSENGTYTPLIFSIVLFLDNSFGVSIPFFSHFLYISTCLLYTSFN